MSKEQMHLKLRRVTPDEVARFRKACESLESGSVDIVSVETVEVLGKLLLDVTVEVRATPEDLFQVGKLCSKLEAQDSNENMHYNQSATVHIPEQLGRLCELLDVTPGEVLQGFANDLSLGAHGTHGSDERNMAVDYFKRVGYGMHLFDYEEIDSIFGGLEWIRYEWGRFGNSKEEEYRAFFNKELDLWFAKWKEARRTKDPETT